MGFPQNSTLDDVPDTILVNFFTPTFLKPPHPEGCIECEESFLGRSKGNQYAEWNSRWREGCLQAHSFQLARFKHVSLQHAAPASRGLPCPSGSSAVALPFEQPSFCQRHLSKTLQGLPGSWWTGPARQIQAFRLDSIHSAHPAFLT